MAFDPNLPGYQLFADVDENGNIKDVLCGKNIVADRQYDFFFYVSGTVSENIDDYKVVLNNFKPQLVLK